MTIRCQCPECGITLKVKDELGGKPGKCPQCHVAFTIPKPEAAEEHLALDDHHDDHHNVVHEASGSKIKRRERAEERPEPPKGDYEPPGTAADIAMNLLKQGEDDDDHHARGKKVGGDKKAGDDRKSGEAKTAGKKKGMAFGKGDRDGVAGGGFDTKETLKNFAVTVLPRALVAMVLVYVAYWLSSTLMSGGSDRPGLGQVSGVVTLDGAPLANAVITFRPEAGEQSGSKVSFSMARTTSEGKYALLYVQGTLGAALGNHRVEIRAQNESGQERIPAKYNNRTELIREVKAGENPMDFALTSK